MFTTAKGLENDIRERLKPMDTAAVYENLDWITARLNLMGMVDLANDLNRGTNDDAVRRLFSVFEMDSLGDVAITGLTPEVIEFECLYGLQDSATGRKGRDISFVVKDISGRFPVNLSQDNIKCRFSAEGPACEIISCAYDSKDMSTRVTLNVQIAGWAFSVGGIFVLHIDIISGKSHAAAKTVKFIAKNSLPDFSKDDFTGGGASEKPLPKMPRSKGNLTETFSETPKKPIIHTKKVIQSRQKNTRLNFDEPGEGIPRVLCGNGAFKAGIPSANAVNISFRLPAFKSFEKKLEIGGIDLKVLPETAVWVEWEDKVMIYNIQYKGFLFD